MSCRESGHPRLCPHTERILLGFPLFGAWQQGFGYFISFRDALVLLIIILIAVVGHETEANA